MTNDYFAQTLAHASAFIAAAIPAIQKELESQDGPDDPEGFIKTGFDLSTGVRDREDLADIAALALRRLAAATPMQ